jgi:predicted nucleotidyltransferase
MASTTQKLMERGLIPGAPLFLKSNIHYETVMGSHAFGVADTSVKQKLPDYDVYGFAIPPKELTFKHLTGWIPGFGDEPPGFGVWQQTGIVDHASGGQGKEWDLNIFSIVRYFELCRENNPNVIDSLFTSEECVLHCTQIGRMVRDQRRLFLSKLCWKKFRGYAHAQLRKLNDKVPIGGRKEIVEKFGYDVKFAYHIVRLFDEAEQIMLEHDLDLRRAKEVMKAIRRGDWSLDQLKAWVVDKDRALEAAYTECKLPEKPPVEPLRKLLLECLEAHYGSIDDCVAQTGWAESLLREIDTLIQMQRRRLYE